MNKNNDQRENVKHLARNLGESFVKENEPSSSYV